MVINIKSGITMQLALW